jgi:hypothetical protein
MRCPSIRAADVIAVEAFQLCRRTLKKTDWMKVSNVNSCGVPPYTPALIGLKNFRKKRFGFRPAHLRAQAKFFGLGLTIVSPLSVPVALSTSFARRQAASLKSLSTHESNSFLRSER